MSHDEFDPYRQWLGIEHAEQPVDHYRLLGLPRFEGDPEIIAAAADERMRHVRSFQTGPRGIHTQRLLNELAAAKLRLLDPKAKRLYDERLRAGPGADEEDDPLLNAPEVILPAAVDTPQLDPMAPLDPQRVSPAPGLPTSTPAPPTGSPRPLVTPVISAGARRGRSPGVPTASAQAGAAPGLLRNLLTFSVGVLVIALLVWMLGNVIQPRNRQPPGQDLAGDPVQAADGGAGGGTPAVPVVAQRVDGEFLLTAENARIEGSAPRRVTSGSRTIIQDWENADDFLSWRIDVRQGNLFDVRLTYAVDDDAAEGRVCLTIGEVSKNRDLRESGGPEAWITDQFPIALNQRGVQTVTLRAVTKPGREVMRFHSIQLEPKRSRN
jgi:hypothetical protein